MLALKFKDVQIALNCILFLFRYLTKELIPFGCQKLKWALIARTSFLDFSYSLHFFSNSTRYS